MLINLWYSSKIDRRSPHSEPDAMKAISENSDTIHLHPSGNAQELRCYDEADKELSYAAFEVTK